MSGKIVSVSGLIGSGKDSIASHLINNYGFVKHSFANPLKDAVAAIFGWDRAMLEGATPEARAERAKEDQWWTSKLEFGFPVTPRWVLQNFGTEVMRKNFNDEIWVLAMERYLDNAHGNVVLTDARFFNELHMLKQREATLLVVFRGVTPWMKKFYQAMDTQLAKEGKEIGDIQWKSASDRHLLVEISDTAAQVAVPGLHISEYQHLAWPCYDRVIQNSKSLASLARLVDSVSQALELPRVDPDQRKAERRT